MIIFLGKDYHLYDNIVKRSKEDKDIVVSCQYPYKIPESLINNYTCVNIHYGILPYFRGMSPIYWQLKTQFTAGVTIHYVDKNFDTGDIIDIFEFPTSMMLAEDVYDSCRLAGVQLLEKHYNGIINGTAPRKPQGEGRYYKKEDCNFLDTLVTKINDDDIDRDVRALHFKGKQYPTIKINNNYYQLRAL